FFAPPLGRLAGQLDACDVQSRSIQRRAADDRIIAERFRPGGQRCDVQRRQEPGGPTSRHYGFGKSVSALTAGAATQSTPKSGERVVYCAVYLNPLLHQALPAAKPSLTRNSDLVDAGLAGRGFDPVDQFADLFFEIVERNK